MVSITAQISPQPSELSDYNMLDPGRPKGSSPFWSSGMEFRYNIVDRFDHGTLLDQIYRKSLDMCIQNHTLGIVGRIRIFDR
jgi:hypothetical protein